MLELGMEVADVFPVAGADGADGVDVEVTVAAVRGEDAVAMRGGGAAQEGGEGFAINASGDLAAGEFDEGGEQVRPADQRVAGGGGFQFAGPGHDERDADAGVVEGPFAEGPGAAVVGGVDEERVAGDFLAHEGAHLAEERVGVRDVGQVACSFFTRGCGVHMRAWNLHGCGVIGQSFAPRRVWMARADEEAERLRGIAAGEKLSHAAALGDAHVRPGAGVEVIELRPVRVRDLADGGDLIAE